MEGSIDDAVCRAKAEPPETALVLLRALRRRLLRPVRLPLPLRRFFTPTAWSASAGRMSMLNTDGLVGGARREIAGSVCLSPGRRKCWPARHQITASCSGALPRCRRSAATYRIWSRTCQSHASYEYTRANLDRLVAGRVPRRRTRGGDQRGRARRTRLTPYHRALAGGEDVALVEGAVARDADAEPDGGEHVDECLDHAPDGVRPELLPDALPSSLPASS
jgi:hypothetical protein